MNSKIIEQFLRKGIADRIFTGAQAVCCDGRGEVRGAFAVGATGGPASTEIDSATLFDIASVTKVFTAGALLRLVERGEIDIDAPLGAYLPDIKSIGLSAATVARTLAHEAGFQAWLPLFEHIEQAERGTPKGRRTAIGRALASPGSELPAGRALYSDIGYIILTELLERTTRRGLEEIIKREVTDPLDLSSVCFRPERDRLDSIVVTHFSDGKGELLCGEVHDDNARAMGGVAGHAGLFATARDIARYGAAWLAALREGEWISRALAGQAVRRRLSGRGLGWDMPAACGSSAGTIFSRESFGHLGFTGCSLWVDPVLDLSVALHTNRVIMGEDQTPIRAFRPAFHDLIAQTARAST